MAREACLDDQGRKRAGRATWSGLRNRGARPTGPLGTRAPVSPGRSTPVAVGCLRVAGAGGSPIVPGLALRGTEAGGSGQEVDSHGVGARSGGRAEGEGGGTSRRTPVPQPAPNKGLQLTASSLRSCLAPASGSS